MFNLEKIDFMTEPPADIRRSGYVIRQNFGKTVERRESYCELNIVKMQ